MTKLIVLSFAALIACARQAYAARLDCTHVSSTPVVSHTYSQNPTEDFAFRDTLPSTDVPKEKWHLQGKWGPCPKTYPKVEFPVPADRLEWSRIRVLEAAARLVGLPYEHFHIPEMGGLDCSNFTSFVYNYAFGIRFTSHVAKQSKVAGRKLHHREDLQPGDLIFLWSSDRTRISHVVIYISPDEIIDSTGIGVQIRPFRGWYKRSYAWARRVLE